MRETLKARQGETTPCVFYVPGLDVSAVLHGDDILADGEQPSLLRFVEQLRQHFEVEVKATLGPEDKDDKEVLLLNRIVRWNPDNTISWEADPRHYEILIAELGLLKAKPQSSPSRRYTKEEHDRSPPLKDEQVTAFRAAAARCMFLGQDRPDVAFAAKECCRGMSRPLELHLQLLKKVGRYLVGRKRVTQTFRPQEIPRRIEVWCDSDHAGCPISRRSTTGGVVCHGVNVIAHWSCTQSTVSLSSGESEFHSLVRACTEGIAYKELAGELLDQRLSLDIMVDSSACKAMSQRVGTGRVKHLDVKQLWVQQATRNKTLTVKKVTSNENVSDILTKPMAEATIWKHMQAMSFTVESGRPKKAPAVTVDLEKMCKASLLCLMSQVPGAEGVHNSTRTGNTAAFHGNGINGKIWSFAVSLWPLPLAAFAMVLAMCFLAYSTVRPPQTRGQREPEQEPTPTATSTTNTGTQTVEMMTDGSSMRSVWHTATGKCFHFKSHGGPGGCRGLRKARQVFQLDACKCCAGE
eukprot:6490283-Amphidinium_carterae.1